MATKEIALGPTGAHITSSALHFSTIGRVPGGQLVVAGFGGLRANQERGAAVGVYVGQHQ